MNNVTGIILAGGKSTRIGSNKAFLQFPDEPLFQIVAKKISPVTGNVIVISNEIPPQTYPDILIKKDLYEDIGPLGGIYTGLYYSSSRHNFVIGCDMPFVNIELINYMKKFTDKYVVTMCEFNKHLEPLYAFYDKDCLTAIETLIKTKNYRIIELLKNQSNKIIPENIVRRFDNKGRAFININNPDDYHRYYKGLL